MKDIGLCGASGFIGDRLSRYLQHCGYSVMSISRDDLKPHRAAALRQKINSCDIIINLAGAPINHRWSRSYKQEISDSRILTTRSLVEAINLSSRVKLFISTSAAGYAKEDRCSQEPQSGFLSILCRLWEAEAKRVKPQVRLAIIRFGVVFAKSGGALKVILSTKRYGFITQLGPISRRIGWIDREDAVRAIEHIIRDRQLSGAINLVAPEQTTQQQLIYAIKRRWGIKFTLRIPILLLKILFGDAAQVITAQNCAQPKRLLESDFQFISPDIERFLLR